MDKSSIDKLAKVHPELARRVEMIVADLPHVRVVQGLRTYAEQDALYAQGRSRKGPTVTNARGGYSNHNFGLAVDLCPFKNNQPDWNDTAGFNAIGAAAKRYGLEWGGDWKFRDMPHVQLRSSLVDGKGNPTAECRSLFVKGGLTAVWAKVSAAVPQSTANSQPSTTQGNPSEKPLPTLKRGMKGPDVKTLQTKLNAKGFKLTVDGDFGAATERAVRAFQNANGLTADGVCGKNTWEKL